MKIEGVLFDFDGTILDTNELIRQSHLNTLNLYYPGKYQSQDVLAFNGPSLYEVYSNIDGERYSEMIEAYRKFNHEKHDEYVALFPETKRMLADIKQAGLKTAIVSTKIRKTVEKGLELFQLSDYFDIVLGGDDYHQVKPNPEALQLAMGKLGISQEATVMVGDNWQDIEAANRAGVPGIFVGWSEKELEDIAPYHPYYVPQDMLALKDWLVTRSIGGNHS